MTLSPARTRAESVIRAAGPQEVLAFVPHALGFQPEESLVLVSLRPPRGRLGLTIRCDLGPIASPDGAEILTAMAAHLRGDMARQVLCILYTHGTVAEARARAETRRAVAAVEEASGMPDLREVWLVTPTGYGAFDCTNSECCPPRGRSLEELASSRVAAEFAVRGSAPRSQRSDLTPPRSSSRSGRRAFAEAYRRARGAMTAGAPGGGEAALRAEAAGMLLSPVPRPSDLGRLAALLADPLRRDEALVWVATSGPQDPTPASLHGATGADLPTLFGAGAPAPDRERMESAVAILSAAVALARGGARADLCAALAWLRWWQGDGAAASLAAADALSIDPEHRLAALVGEILRRGTAPGWALPVSAASDPPVV